MDTGAAPQVGRDGVVPRRWTLHGLNNGLIFSATYHGVRRLPRTVSYVIGTLGTLLAWMLMRTCRAAVADNLRAIFPDESEAQLQRRALATFRAYAFDSIDFLRAIEASERDAHSLFDHTAESQVLFERLLAEGRGIIAVTGHCGNWEMGSVLMQRTVETQLTIVAMAEANPEVNRIRNQIRARLGVGDAGSAAITRYRAPDPPPPRREPGGCDAHGQTPGPRPSGGDAAGSSGMVPAHSGSAELPLPRTAASLLHQSRSARPVHGPSRRSYSCGAGSAP